MMSVKHSPPPVADLWPRKPLDPMLLTPGSKTCLHSNRLILAWPSASSSDSATPTTYQGGGDNRFSSIAERIKTHAGFVVSPSGKPILKVQSSYQGYFTPGGTHEVSHIGKSPLRNNHHSSSPGIRNHDRTGSFISFNDSSSSRGLQNAVGSRQTSGRDAQLIASRQSPHLVREEKKVRFRGSADNNGESTSTNRLRESLGRERESSHSDISMNGSNSPRNLSNLSHLCSERDRLHLQYKSKAAALYGGPSPGVRACQMLCWLLMTIMVCLILLLCILFVYVDYQRSVTPAIVAPADQVTLSQYLKQHLIGQEIAIEEISSLFERLRYSSGDLPVVPIVASFHGGVGVGKSFTNQLISNYYFSEFETTSNCVSTFSVHLCHSWPLEMTRSKLKDWLTVRETSCPFQLHVLDDLGSDTPCSIVSIVEDMLSTFISKSSNHKHAIVMVTDVASIGIKQIALEYLQTSRQELLSIDHFTFPIKKSWTAIDEFRRDTSEPDVNDEHECNFGTLSGHINVSIPFLPLERHHVKQCVSDIAKKKQLQVSLEQVEWVADQMVYEPQSWPVFTSSGCKLVSEKLNIIYNFGVL